MRQTREASETAAVEEIPRIQRRTTKVESDGEENSSYSIPHLLRTVHELF